jgi:hypothetical protein
MQTLGKVVAVERAVRQRGNKVAGSIHKLAQKPEPLTGQTRTYVPLDDEGVQLPPQNKNVQTTIAGSEGLIDQFAAALSPGLNMAATKDYANMQARADVVVGGETLLADVPVSHLLFLEHQLGEIRTFIGSLTTLDPAVNWHFNPNTGLFEGDPTGTSRTDKQEIPVVLYEATDKHPAQVKVTVKDVIVGTWTVVPLSGAIPSADKKRLIGRVEALIDAVRVAREAANQTPAPPVEVAGAIFQYLFDF